MRQKRAKSYRKQLLVYSHTFKFREPYQALVDDEIVQAAYDSKFNLWKGLQNTLQADVKIMITQCCMQKLYATENQHLIDMAKQYERRRCNHPPKDPKEPIDCIQDVVNVDGTNKHRYVVASQNIELRRKLRRIPGVPIIHINRAVMILEPLSDASIKISKKTEQEKLYKGLNDAKFAGIKKSEDATEDKDTKDKNDNKPKKRKLGVKQPNPLSMKKKKAKTETSDKQQSKDQEDNIGNEKKKRRTRKHKGKSNTGNSEKNDIEESTKTEEPSVLPIETSQEIAKEDL